MAIHDILFSLLRLSLGTRADEMDFSALTNADWKELIDLSFDQGVAAIAVDGLQKLCGQHPEMELALDSPELEDLKYEWFGEVIRSENDFKKYVDDIASLAKTYSEAGIETMILKGYGLSLNYPEPSHRPTGDIDVYLFGKWREADKLMADRGIDKDYSHHHHSVFNWNGQMVENHYDIDDRYASLNGRLADDLLKGIVRTNRKQLEVQGVEIYLPSATFNGIFLTTPCSRTFRW